MLILATGRFFGEFCWGHPAQRGMGTARFMVYAPCSDLAPGILHGDDGILFLNGMDQGHLSMGSGLLH